MTPVSLCTAFASPTSPLFLTSRLQRYHGFSAPKTRVYVHHGKVPARRTTECRSNGPYRASKIAVLIRLQLCYSTFFSISQDSTRNAFANCRVTSEQGRIFERSRLTPLLERRNHLLVPQGSCGRPPRADTHCDCDLHISLRWALLQFRGVPAKGLHQRIGTNSTPSARDPLCSSGYVAPDPQVEYHAGYIPPGDLPMLDRLISTRQSPHTRDLMVRAPSTVKTCEDMNSHL